MSSRWCAVGMDGLCLRFRVRALLRCVRDGVGYLLHCILCWGGGGDERVTRVDSCSSLVDWCVHSNFLRFSSSCVSLN